MHCDYSIDGRVLVFQWHITSRCNRRCVHCYQEKYESSEMDFQKLLDIIEQYKELLLKLGRPGHINVTGGEPFIRDDFMKLLHILSQNNEIFSFGILTNGTMIDRETARRLKELGTAFVQVSIEGNREIHDSIRGEGNLSDVLKALDYLSENDIKTLVSFTAFKDNYKSFPEVLKLCRKHKVFKLWTDRLVPFGGAEDIKGKCLDINETMEYINIINRERTRKRFLRGNSGPIVETKRALQFITTRNMPYKCSAGKSIITILEDGSVLPCRRLPIVIGNVLETTLISIYENSSLIRGINSQREPPKGCERCSYYFLCGGGAKCISYAVSGDIYSRDPGCPIVWE